MKEEIKIIDVILILVAVILITINIIVYMKIYLIPNSNINNSTIKEESNEIDINKADEEVVLEKLKSMSERDRMEFYFSEYATYIEDGAYEKAYDLLYPEFKNNFFPTLEKFEEYAKKIYPEFMTFSYNNIDRQGYIYVLNIDIIDIDNKDNKKSHRVVIQENDFNDFVLSFQVI